MYRELLQEEAELACAEVEDADAATTGADGEPASPSQEFARRRVAQASGALVLGLAAFRLCAGGGAQLRAADPSESAVSASSSDESPGYLYYSRSVKTACTNLRSVLLSERHATLPECSQFCKETAGCTGFGFLSNRTGCGSGAASSSSGKPCRLLQHGCDADPDLCWDHHDLASVASRPPPWSASGVGKGCTNWMNITMLNNFTVEDNPAACFDLCRRNPSCVGFGFQERSCGNSSVGGVAKGAGIDGACHIWNDTCDQDDNECWNDYVIDREALSIANEYPYRYPDFWWGQETPDGSENRLTVFPYWIDNGTAPGSGTKCPSDWPSQDVTLSSPIKSDHGNADITSARMASCDRNYLPTDAASEGKSPVPQGGVPGTGDGKCLKWKWHYVDNAAIAGEPFCTLGGLRLPTHCIQTCDGS